MAADEFIRIVRFSSRDAGTCNAHQGIDADGNRDHDTVNVISVGAGGSMQYEMRLCDRCLPRFAEAVAVALSGAAREVEA